MSTAVKIALAAAALFFLTLVVGCATVVSFNNTAVAQEADLKAQYGKNQAVFDNTWKTVAQVANVADAHSEKFKEVVIAAVQGRYGNDKNVLFKAIAEANGGQALPTDLYLKVQQVIEANNAKFLANQTELLSKKQAYETFLGTFPNSTLASFLGFPKADLDKYKIVTSGRTDNAFETGKDEPLMPFGKK